MATVDDIKNPTSKNMRLVDIRKNPDEFQIPGSQRYEGAALENGEFPFSDGEKVVLYCGSGNSCSRIAQTLRERGHANVEALEGGYAAWKESGLPLEPIIKTR
jgi:rhodanese-related sulfurtransferase